MKRILACLLAGFLACGPVAAGSAFSGKAVAGDVAVSWMTVTGSVARSSGIAPSLSLIAFVFECGGTGNTVGEEKWAAEAARHGVDVRTLKIMLGNSVYVTSDGELATCTLAATRKGLCGGGSDLTLDRRISIAQSILEQSGKCRWTGFDTQLQDRIVSRAGGDSVMLWIAADCR